MIAVTGITEVAVGEAAIVLMTGEGAIAIHGLLPGSATTDTEALLQRAELTATSQGAPTETNLNEDAARPPTIVHAHVAAPLLLAAVAAATHPAYPARLLHLAKLADGPYREILSTARPTARARASAVMKAADPDPVRVLLHMHVAHDRPDVTANPTTPAAEDLLLKTAAPRHPKGVTAVRPHPVHGHRPVGVVTSQARAPARARLLVEATRGTTMSDATSAGPAQVVRVAAGATAATTYRRKRSKKRMGISRPLLPNSAHRCQKHGFCREQNRELAATVHIASCMLCSCNEYTTSTELKERTLSCHVMSFTMVSSKKRST